MGLTGRPCARYALLIATSIVACLMLSPAIAGAGTLSKHHHAHRVDKHHHAHRVDGYAVGPGAHLRHAHLAGANLQGLDLAGADLRGANLTGANLTGANLSGARIQKAKFKRAKFRGLIARQVVGSAASLPQDWSDLDGFLIGPSANLKSADLHGLNLDGIDLAGANLTGADLSGDSLSDADLQSSNFTRADFSGLVARGVLGTPSVLPENWSEQNGLLLGPTVNLQSANLTGLNLNDVDLEGANLTAAQMTGDSLQGTILNGDELMGADLSGANLSDAGVENANLTSADLSHATLTGASLVGSTLSSANFTDSTLAGSVLAGADLAGADTAGASSGGNVASPASLPAGWSVTDGYLVGPGADLSGANLAGAGLTGRNLANADLAYATLSSANLEGANLTGADLANADLSSANLSSSTLSGADLSNTNLTSASLAGATVTGTAGAPSVLPADWALVGGTLQQISSTLTETQYFQQGQWIESSNGEFTVDMQSDGNMVEYQGGTAIWATGTSGPDVGVMQGDCNFVVYNSSEVGQPSGALYTTGSGGDPNAGCTFSVAADGSLSVSTSSGTVRWERYANGTIFTHRIQMTSNAPLLSGPSTSSNSIGTIPDGESPQYVCWTTGPPVGNVNVYFYVLWDGTAGYYPSYYDNSVYSTDSRISIDYGIPACGSVPTTFTPPSNGATGTQAPATIAAPIATTTSAPIEAGPGSGSTLVTMPAGTTPGFLCWATGPSVDSVNVWFKVYWAGLTGYYPSGLDNSTYPTDESITSKYGIPQCAGSTSTSGGGSSSGSGSSPTSGHSGGTITGQAILNAAAQWIGKTSYCWDAGDEDGPTHGEGDSKGEAPDCTNGATTGFDCSGLAIYAIYAAGGPDLFAEAHGPSLSNYGTAVSESAMQVGDIISFDNGQHFAIYAGGGNVVQADTAVSFTGGGWKDGVSEIPLRWLTADLTVTGVRRFS
jgi:uncharacterized protein YjbI with pentapeptide repeats